MDQKSAPSQPHAPFQTGGTGFNEVPPNTQPFHDVNTAADLGKTQAGTLEDFAQPHVGDVYVDQDASAPRASASDTITGATSKDVHTGYGHPGSGMSSKEFHHDGQPGRVRQNIPPEAQSGHGFVPKDESEMDR